MWQIGIWAIHILTVTMFSGQVYGGYGIVPRRSDYRKGETFIGECFVTKKLDGSFTTFSGWTKKPSTNDVEHNVTLVSEMQEPFASVGRYTLTTIFTNDEKRYIIKIIDLKNEDNGELKCYVDDNSYTSAVFTLNVFEPISSVAVILKSSNNLVTVYNVTGEKIEFNSNGSATERFGCQVLYGRRQASSLLFIDNKNETHLTTHIFTTFSGHNGLSTQFGKLIETARKAFSPEQSLHGKNVTCKAFPFFSTSRSFYPEIHESSIVLAITGPPEILCDISNTGYILGHKNAVLTCTVKSYPGPLCSSGCSLSWMWKNNSQNVNLNISTTPTRLGGYSSLVKVVDANLGVYTVTLTIDEVTEKTYKKYMVQVSNGKGSDQKELNLHKEITSGADAGNVQSIFNLMFGIVFLKIIQ